MYAVIFDLDGTLCDSAPDLHASANAMLAELGFESLPLKTIRSFVGNGIPKLVERVMREVGIPFDQDNHAALTKRFEAIYSANPADKTTLYPGVLTALEALKFQGVPVGVCTNKVQKISLQVLEALDIYDFFDSVIGGDSLPTRKPDPAMLFACIKELGASSAVYVGDSEVDSATAVEANIPFLLFSEGYRKSPIEMIPHNQVFADFHALPALLLDINLISTPDAKK